MTFIPLKESQLRQYIDAESVFTAWRRAMADAKTVRGSMFWRDLRGKATLIRVSTTGAQTVIGKDSLEERGIYERFMERKTASTQRVKSLKEALVEQTRLNRALRVGRTPDVVVRILNALDANGYSEHLTTIGTHALFAYESAAGVRIQPGALATKDVDLFFDVRKKLSFFEKINKSEGSLIQVLQKADPSFEVMSDEKQTAINQNAFKVDIVRREAREGDPHPLRMSKNEDDLWAVQVPNAELIDSADHFSQMIISTTGEMALMNTIDPVSFARLKKIISKSPKRDALKRPKDALQAEIVDCLISEYLPQFFPNIAVPKPELNVTTTEETVKATHERLREMVLAIDQDAKIITPLAEGSSKTYFGTIVARLGQSELGVAQFSSKLNAYILHLTINVPSNEPGEVIEIQYKSGQVTAINSRGQGKGGKGD